MKFVIRECSPPAPASYYHSSRRENPRMGKNSLDIGESVVPRHVWIPSVKLSELLQTVYWKIVEKLFSPILLVRIVEPFDKIQDVAPFLAVSKDLVNIVFLALFDVVGLSKNFGGVNGSAKVALSVGFQQRDMEDIVNLPLPQ
jgi:hypothetical protein